MAPTTPAAGIHHAMYTADFVAALPKVRSHQLGALVEYPALPHRGCYHRALVDAEMIAHLWLRMPADIIRHLHYREIFLNLMQQLQSIARNQAVTYLESYRGRHGLTEITGS